MMWPHNYQVIGYTLEIVKMKDDKPNGLQENNKTLLSKDVVNYVLTY